jgi:hypothetical protein
MNFLLQNFYILVDIDERQHQYGNYIDEFGRMKKIQRKKGTPVVFIRYNPDKYDLVRHKKLIDILVWIEHVARTEDTFGGFMMSDNKRHKLLVHYICYDTYKTDMKEFMVLD